MTRASAVVALEILGAALLFSFESGTTRIAGGLPVSPEAFLYRRRPSCTAGHMEA
jgi:hypothetical protein